LKCVCTNEYRTVPGNDKNCCSRANTRTQEEKNNGKETIDGKEFGTCIGRIEHLLVLLHRLSAAGSKLVVAVFKAGFSSQVSWPVDGVEVRLRTEGNIQSQRPSDFAPAFGRAVIASR
jgi:hypothetical protein